MDYEIFVWHTDGYISRHEILHGATYEEALEVCKEYMDSSPFFVSYEIKEL